MDYLDTEKEFRYKGFTGTARYIAESKTWHGKINNILDLVNFESENESRIEEEFRKAVDDYISFMYTAS